MVVDRGGEGRRRDEKRGEEDWTEVHYMLSNAVCEFNKSPCITRTT